MPAAHAAGVARAGVAAVAAEPKLARTRLANGIRIVTERMPEARSVTTGFWVGVGARDEPLSVSGASHFLEHLLFKGTEARTARQIAETVDQVGGEMNAFTAKEHTAYYTRLPDRDLAFGLDLLCDVLSAPAFRPHEIEAERQVILEEILMSADEPADRVHTLLAEALFPDHPLGREVLGTEDSIAAMGRDDISGFFAEHYRPTNLVIAAAGNLDHDQVVAGVERRFPDTPAGVAPERRPPEREPVAVMVQRRPTEQVNLALGWRTFARGDDDRYALAVLNQVLGGGMSSRLFQQIREERGLAYSVYSFTSGYADTGALQVFAGTAPARATQVLGLIDDEIDRLGTDGIAAGELDVARGYLEGSLLLGLEDSGGRMARLGNDEIARGEITPVDEHVARIRAVTIDDVARVIKRVFTGPRSLAAVGPIDAEDLVSSPAG
ncbi:pitrilysin family protein [soil metagenome]